MLHRSRHLLDRENHAIVAYTYVMYARTTRVCVSVWSFPEPTGSEGDKLYQLHPIDNYCEAERGFRCQFRPSLAPIGRHNLPWPQRICHKLVISWRCERWRFSQERGDFFSIDPAYKEHANAEKGKKLPIEPLYSY